MVKTGRKTDLKAMMRYKIQGLVDVLAWKQWREIDRFVGERLAFLGYGSNRGLLESERALRSLA